MFKLLKEKLKSWLGKTEEKKPEAKKEKTKLAKAKEKPSKKEAKIKEKISAKAPTDKQLKQLSETIKEEVPLKFEVGELKYEPDIEKIKEIEEPVIEKPKGFFSKLFGKKEKPEEKEELKEKILEKLPAEKEEEKSPGFFSKLSSKFTTSTLTKENVEEIFEDLEIILLESNVALEVVDKIKENLLKDLVGIEVKKSEIFPQKNFGMFSLSTDKCSLIIFISLMFKPCQSSG